MLRTVISFCLRFRLVVLLLTVGILAWGATAAYRAPWDVFPEFAPPQVIIQTEAPGLSTEEVEQLITVPLESAINGVFGLETLRSSSVPALSVITVTFEEGTNVLDARQLINQRLTEVQAMLPAAAEMPRITPLKTSLSRLAMVGLTSDSVSLRTLRTLADWTFKQRLLAVSGVAQVEIFGGEVRQYQILVTPQQLARSAVTLDEVVRAAGDATGFGGAGYLDTTNQRLPIRQRTRIESPADLAAAPVAYRDGVAIGLGQVADVCIGPANQPGDATIDGQPGILLIIHKQPRANTLKVTEQLDRAIDELAATLPPGVVVHPEMFRQATFIRHAIQNLNQAIFIGCVLVALILTAFLFQWRTVVISLTAIPLSLLGAILVLRFFGASLNAMTLGGLAIALGAVVDDAIVDVENVLRRLLENQRLPSPAPPAQVVLSASLEVRSAVVYASFIVILVFLPVFFLEGLAGTLFRSMGYAYVAAIFASLVVALTVTPAMCLLLLRSSSRRTREPIQLRALNWIYARTLGVLLRFPRLVALAGVALLATAALAITQLGGEFLPELRESNLVLFMAGKPDMALRETTRVGGVVAQQLKETGRVLSVAQQTGRADLSEDTWGPNISEVWIVIDDQPDYDETLALIRDRMDKLPGFDFQIKQFLRERLDEVLTGATADVVIRVVGPELNALRQQAGAIADAVRHIDGVADLRVEQQVDIPQVQILLRPRLAAQFGLSVGALNRTIQTLLRGRTVGQVYETNRVFDVVVRSDPRLRSDPTRLGQLLIDTPNKGQVPLGAVADISVVKGPNAVNREGGSRRIQITCNARGRDVVRLMHAIQSRIKQDVRLAAGYHLEFGGEYEARQAAQQKLILLTAAALIGIFVLLYLDFQQVGLTLLVMLSVPLAGAGGIAAVLLAGGNVSLGSLVGFVTVFGIAVRNGILLISHYQHLRSVEKMPFGRPLIVRGAAERLAPILMTACTTGLALLPLVVLGDRPGHEIERPMAIVILGGLISSTFLSLVLLPALYSWIGRRTQDA